MKKIQKSRYLNTFTSDSVQRTVNYINLFKITELDELVQIVKMFENPIQPYSATCFIHEEKGGWGKL